MSRSSTALQVIIRFFLLRCLVICQPQDEMAWIKICTNKGFLGMEKARTCKDGFWFKKPINVTCACGHGVWVFATGWCDLKAHIIVADRSACFSVGLKGVRYIRPIGHYYSSYSPFYFASSSGLEFIQPLQGPSLNYDLNSFFHPDYDIHLGAIYRQRYISAQGDLACYDMQGKKPFAMRYYALRWPYTLEHFCYYPKISSFDHYTDINSTMMLPGAFDRTKKGQRPKNLVWNVKPNSCNCTETQNKPKKGKHNKGKKAKMSKKTKTNEDSKENDTKWSTVCNKKRKDVQYELAKKTIQEINEQTKRIAVAAIAYDLKGVEPIHTSFQEMVPTITILESSFDVAEKICAKNEVPKEVLRSLRVMFLAALRESLQHYRSSYSVEEVSALHEIRQRLETCREKAHVIKSFDPALACPPTFHIEKEDYKGAIYKAYREMPRALTSNITKFDLVMETAWKIIMLNHYYCDRHFRNNSMYHSLYENGMQKLFNRWLLHRWFYTGIGPDIYSIFFQMYNLDLFSINLDRCVAAAREASEYKKWIRRPRLVKYCGDGVFENVADDDKNIFYKVLDVINPKADKLGDKAICLHQWHMPVSISGIGYDPVKLGHHKKGCIKFKKEEWWLGSTPIKPWVNSVH